MGVGKPIGADKRRRTKTPRELFGRAVTEKRIAAGLSQAELGSRLGYSTNYVGLMERGEANVTCDVMATVSALFGLSVATFWVYAEGLQARPKPRL